MKLSKSILLVEDDKDDQNFFIAVLSAIENVTLSDVVPNENDLSDKLGDRVIVPDLIFMNADMPDVNAIECLSGIIKNPELRNIPVVILSTDNKQIEMLRKLGAKTFLKKSDEGKILREQLEQMINLDLIFDSDFANQIFQPAPLAF